MKLLPVALTALALLASACATAMAQTPPACPPAEARLQRSYGADWIYHGTYEGLPELCHVQRGSVDGFYYYGLWKSDWPGAGEALPALATVTHGSKGTSANFITRSIPGWQWQDTFTNMGVETVVVDGRPVAAQRIDHERQGIEGNTFHSIIATWRDLRSGVTLRSHETLVSGQSYGPEATWTARAVLVTKP